MYCLSWGKQNYFFYFHFYALFGMSLKGVVESSLLSKEKPLTPNINKVIRVEFLEGELKIRNSAKNRCPDSGSFFSKTGEIKLVQTFLLQNYRSICAGVRFGKNRFAGCQENKLLRSAQPIFSQIWPNAVCVGSLRTKKTCIWSYKASARYIQVQYKV